MPSQTPYSIANALATFDIVIDDVQANVLINDSRLAGEQSIFCAVIGSLQDGRKYIDKAIEAGCPLVIAQCENKQEHGQIKELTFGNNKVSVVSFYALNEQLTRLAQHFYGYPHHALKMVGITGTNGKTSTSQFVANCFKALGQQSAVIGTLGAGVLGQVQPINNTTPGPTELNHWLAQFVQQGVKAVAMEVSSHALDQHRVSPEMMDIAVFTNLSRDHLDYHHTMEQYAHAKYKLFTGSKDQIAVINGDDPYGDTWIQRQAEQQEVIVYGRTDRIADNKRYVKAKAIQHTHQGLAFTVQTEKEEFQVNTQLVGDFNVDNLLATIAVMRAAEFSLADIIEILPTILPCNGRMETFHSNGKATCVVDYAHTPDALENAILACRQHCEGNLWVVFGCGGDRDQGKRPQMGEVAERLADYVVVTNDNPRHEKPELIASNILAGTEHPENIEIKLDRIEAVTSTLIKAAPQDMVLLAGKGHEETIQIGNEVIEYSERKLVMSLYNLERPTETGAKA